MNPFLRSRPRTSERTPQKCRNVIYPIRFEWLSLRRSVLATTYRITWVETPIRLAFINNFVPSVARNTLLARTSGLESTTQKHRRDSGYIAIETSEVERNAQVRRQMRAWRIQSPSTTARLLEKRRGERKSRLSFAAKTHDRARVRLRSQRDGRRLPAGL